MYDRYQDWRLDVDNMTYEVCTPYVVLPPFQIISYSKNLGESKFFKFDQIYIAK